MNSPIKTYTKKLVNIRVGEVVLNAAEDSWWRVVEIHEHRREANGQIWVDLNVVAITDGFRGRVYGYGHEFRTLRR